MGIQNRDFIHIGEECIFDEAQTFAFPVAIK